jgi:hypothetical protein
VVGFSALVVAGCTGGGTDGATSRTTTGKARALTAADAQVALPSAEDLSVVADGISVTDDGPIRDGRLEPICGRGAGVGPAARSARFRVLRNDAGTVELTASVFEFAREREARASVGAFRAAVRACRGTTRFTNPAGSFVRDRGLVVQNGGDEAVTLFGHDDSSGLRVGEHVVRRGRDVLELRFSVASSASVDPGALTSFATEAGREFASWADDE